MGNLNKKLTFLGFGILVSMIVAAMVYGLYAIILQKEVSGFCIYLGFFMYACGLFFLYKTNHMVMKRRSRIGYGIGTVTILLLNAWMVEQSKDMEETFTTTGYIVFFLCLFVSFLCYLKTKEIHKFYQKYQVLCNWIVFLIVPVVSFFILEVCTGQWIGNIAIDYWGLNLMWYFLLMGIIYLISNRMKVAMIATLLISCLVGMIDGYVVVFRGSPILPSDLTLLSTALEVSGGYSYTPTSEMLLGMILTIGMIMVVCWVKEKKVHLRTRGIMVIGYLILCIISVVQFRDAGNSIKNYINLWQPVNTYLNYGTCYGFGLNVLAMEVEKPEGYSTDAVNEILANYQSDSITNETEYPNVIVVMSEAFSDLSVVGDFETNQDYMPFLHSLTDNTVKGYAYPSVVAGRTANSEYEFLTGNTIGFLPSGTVPYQQYIDGTTSSFAQILKSVGYETVALHPSEANNYRRATVYPLLGIDTFYSIDDFWSKEYVRYYVSDECDFNKVISLYENRDETSPFFLFNVTMQNHSSYSSNLIEKTVNVSSESEYPDTEEYLSLIKKTDEALQMLIGYFSQEEEPTYIVFFGDHQPNFESSFFEDIIGSEEADYTIEELQSRYTVPFMIWSNQEMEEKTVDRISLNYLSSYFAHLAGLPMTAYQKYLLDLFEDIPVVNVNGYIDKDGNYYEATEIRENSLLLDYNMIVYNTIIDNQQGTKWAHELSD